jgi:hypothetical protein
MFGSVRNHHRTFNRRTVGSIVPDETVGCIGPSNIAEGYGRKTTTDDIRSLYIAYESTCEPETQILLSWDLGYIESVVIEKIKGCSKP